jgi:hypothetical protein
VKTALKSFPKIPAGINGFDDLTGGSLPRGRPNLNAAFERASALAGSAFSVWRWPVSSNSYQRLIGYLLELNINTTARQDPS